MTSFNISKIELFSSSLSAVDATTLRILSDESSLESTVSYFFIDLLRVNTISLDNVHAENMYFPASLLKIDTSSEISMTTLTFNDVKFEP